MNDVKAVSLRKGESKGGDWKSSEKSITEKSNNGGTRLTERIRGKRAVLLN